MQKERYVNVACEFLLNKVKNTPTPHNGAYKAHG